MIDPNKVTEAVMEFTANPAWKDIFTNAPGGAMERLAISFYFSKFHDQFKPEDFQEYRDLRDEYEKSLTAEDLNYLIENTDKENAKKHYQEILDKLQQGGGEAMGNLRFEKEGEGVGKEDGQQSQEQPTEEDTTTVEAEAKEEPNGEEKEQVAVKEEEQTSNVTSDNEAVNGEKKKNLEETEKDEKYDTALSVALEYLQKEQEAMGNKKSPEQSKTN